ncbi:hypothetical protein EMCG_01932 [[Emmonsia] crescens]|uniref:Dynamin GTPase n=1 Tax=[Emmonsia] crescens TaxID=73230 RepID=A0A0G2HZQ8_9EURO|nr:hypothetical protein EMCG_01932 [Emmonsia crescens UAMH 3008]
MKSETSTYSKLADPALLDKIDKLFACNVGDHIDLPQLVVVGDQFSGKSSITFRRAREKRVAVSIIPGAAANLEHAERVRSWEIANLPELSGASFTRIMAEVNKVMGLRDSNSNDIFFGNIFSTDVLRLEICGPDEDRLSIIDVPGIFKNTTSGLTTKEDIQLVRDMVQVYMQNPRTVMLTIVPANVDIATQEILEMAKEVDPLGERTIGVFTKPDLVDIGAEKKVIDLLEGKESGWKMGWSLVRNPGQQDLDDGKQDRDKSEERFFRSKFPWNTLDADKVGVNSLRARLQEILTTHIRREFPHVKSEISKTFALKKEALESLGPERDSADSQRKYLLDIITEFQQIASLALVSDYGGNHIFDREPSTKLATILVNRNDMFSENMERWGNEYIFASVDGEEVEEGYEEKDTNEDGGKDVSEEEKEGLRTRSMKDPTGLDDILFQPTTVKRDFQTHILTWLGEIFRGCRGFEIGAFNPGFLSTIIKKQSANWECLSLDCVSDMICAVHTFILKVLKSICTDERVREHLLSILMNPLLDIYQRSLSKVKFLLHVERDGTPKTLNHYFNDNLKNAAMKKRAISDHKYGTVIRLKDIVHHNPMSSVERTIQDLHDILKSYYKVARKRFVDNVCMQAAVYHLVMGPQTPLKQFSPAFVQGLSPEQLKEIAGEDPKF